MMLGIAIWVGVLGGVSYLIWLVITANRKRNIHSASGSTANSEKARAKRSAALSAGRTEVAMQRTLVCPHCQSKGTVTATDAKKKSGISGGKATGAVITGGISVLATGLSRKQSGTAATCSNCGTTWFIESV